MTENEKTPAMENFGIQDTMSMGAGSTELLADLMEPETGTGDPGDLKPIIKEGDPAPPTPPTPPTTTGDVTTKKPETEKPDTSISDFLTGGDDGEEGDGEEGDGTDQNVQGGEGTEGGDLEDGDPSDTPEGTEYGALANELLDLGVFTQEEGEEPLNIQSPEELLERFNSEKQKGSIQMVNDFIGQFGEDYQSAFDSIFVKGADPKEYFNTFNELQDLNGLDLTIEGNQKAVLRRALNDQGFESEDIELEIERLSNYGDLETVSQRHHKVLLKKDAAKLEGISNKAAADLQQKAGIRNQYISNVQNIIKDKVKEKGFDGIPLNPKLANELHDFLLVDKYKTPSGETLTDFDKTILDLKRPENHETKVKLGLLLKLLEKDPTLSTIQKTSVTKKTNTMFKNVIKHKSVTPKANSKGAAPRWFK